jgi:hypothetical protein
MYPENQNMQIATTILNQLGGRRFLACTGATNLVAIQGGLMLKLKRNASSANYLRITLGGDDLYKVEFLSARGEKIKTVKLLEGVYNDMLQDLFYSVTGMYCTLSHEPAHRFSAN